MYIIFFSQRIFSNYFFMSFLFLFKKLINTKIKETERINKGERKKRRGRQNKEEKKIMKIHFKKSEKEREMIVKAAISIDTGIEDKTND